jgi:hypothetical protein
MTPSFSDSFTPLDMFAAILGISGQGLLMEEGLL